MQHNSELRTPQESLDDLRQKIDAIDQNIIRLLLERVEHVKEVGERKKASNPEGASFLRPGREATMSRKLAAAVKGHYPATAIVQMWRMIISASLGMETSLKIAAFAAKEHPASFWLAHEYFGAFTPVMPCPTSSQVIREVANYSASVGALPLPTDEHDPCQDEWWIQLAAGENLPRVFAHIPFVEDPLHLQAVAIGHVTPEQTGDDTTLLVIDVNESVSKDRIIRTFADNGTDIKVRAMKKSPHKVGARNFLVSAKGFMPQGHATLEGVASTIGAQAIRITVLGIYATPIAA
ncbi:MAG: pheA [Rickettsiales bacterium]|nr:pheA [Rickettsiales bacterium]